MTLLIINYFFDRLTSSFDAPCATSAVVAMSAAIMAGSISSSPSPDIIFSMICKWKMGCLRSYLKV